MIRNNFKLVRESDWGRTPLERDFTLAWLKRAPDKPLAPELLWEPRPKLGPPGPGASAGGDLSWTNWGGGLIHSSFGESGQGSQFI